MKKDPRQAGDRMISGKLRAKAARDGARHTSVAVDGVEYAWSQRHGWTAWDKGVQAISISVSLRPARTRELILDLTFAARPQDDAPSAARVARALEAGIRAARDAGWEPDSRGRAFRLELGEGVG